jgi:hypothetical protein
LKRILGAEGIAARERGHIERTLRPRLAFPDTAPVVQTDMVRSGHNY